jgi:hypothetical protein
MRASAGAVGVGRVVSQSSVRVRRSDGPIERFLGENRAVAVLVVGPDQGLALIKKGQEASAPARAPEIGVRKVTSPVKNSHHDASPCGFWIAKRGSFDLVIARAERVFPGWVGDDEPGGLHILDVGMSPDLQYVSGAESRRDNRPEPRYDADTRWRGGARSKA